MVQYENTVTLNYSKPTNLTGASATATSALSNSQTLK